ncbi:MAG: BRCT domain-containing protein [Clostridia bacterium]|nr:BRCT domain-containing protein [Clostridia bacterium]
MNIKNQIICFTGKSIYTRNKMQQLAIRAGAKINTQITTDTTLLVIGQQSGSKLDLAIKKGIPIIADETFIKIVMKS